ncbi:MAG: RIP metalloprotease RseP [Saprospiraceae bacterium]|nr:RIP metalloprotease RseP [Candidatus Brachybacter algidus]
MDIVIMIAQLILSLSILVILHELGHFIPAKLFGTRVEKFYLFFDPWFSLFKFKKGDTEYGVGWLPLGGYVKISGMVDESMDKEFKNRAPEPWEFRSKKAWQRLIIMIGGVTVNFILGFFIFGLMYFFYGETKLPAKNMTYGISTTQLANDAGFMDGDKIVSLGGKPYEYFSGPILVTEIMLNDLRDVKVEREGQLIEVKRSNETAAAITSNQKDAVSMINARLPTIVAKVDPKSPGGKAGLTEGDQVVMINNKPVPYYHELMKELESSKNKTISLEVVRKKDTMVLSNIKLDEKGVVGFNPYGPDKYYKYDVKKYSLIEAMPAGVHKGVDFLSKQISAFGKMFSGDIKASESLGGFASITKLFPSEWNWREFWNITAILSLILAFMNLLPIPALDGGYIMFLLWEVVTGKKVNDKVMEVATTIGMVLLLGLLLYANGLDIFRALK